MFQSIVCQLPEGKYNGHADQLRRDVADFLKDNPISPDGQTHYCSFLAPAVNHEHNPFDADTEKLTEEDQEIESTTDNIERDEKRWQKYL